MVVFCVTADKSSVTQPITNALVALLVPWYRLSLPFYYVLDFNDWNGMCYTLFMKTQPIINTNPYLKDAESRERFVQRSVRTSCGVEGICEKAGTILNVF